MHSVLVNTILILIVIFLTFTSGQKFGMPIIEQPIKSNIRQPRIMGMPLTGSEDLGMSRMPPDILQLPRRPQLAATRLRNFGMDKSLGPRTRVPPPNRFGNPFSNLLTQRSAGSALQRLSNAKTDLTKPNIGPLRDAGLIKPLLTPTYSSIHGNDVFVNKNHTLQQRLLNFLLTRLQLQDRYNQRRQQPSDGGFPDMNTLFMIKAINPEFAESGAIKSLICMRCQGQQNFFCIMMFCMGEA